MTAAIGLADEERPDALTMQAVAAQLGSYSAMALYRYVQSKEPGRPDARPGRRRSIA